MARKHLAALPLALTAMMALGAPALADVRTFPHTYPYNTPEAGEREIELYTDYSSANRLRNQLELGYGVTDHLSLSLYAIYDNLHTADRHWDALKLEGRYRLAEAGEWPVDTTLYLEYEKPFAADDPQELEGKVLLEKTLGKVVLGSNLVVAKALGDEPFEYEATFGTAYAVNEDLRVGVEGLYEEIGAGDKFLAGPTLSFNPGATRLVGGVYFGGANEVQGRLIIGQEF